MTISDIMEDVGCSSGKGKTSNGSTMMDFDIDGLFEVGDYDWDDDEDEDDNLDMASIKELGGGFLRNFCKKASAGFFEKYGLISHQIDSYNDFIRYGIQKVFDSVGEIHVEPGYDPSKKGEGEWKHASVKFGNVILDRPKFWAGEKYSAYNGEEYLNMWPRHARLQNMTYSARIIVETHVQARRCLLLSNIQFLSCFYQSMFLLVLCSFRLFIIIHFLIVLNFELASSQVFYYVWCTPSIRVTFCRNLNKIITLSKNLDQLAMF